MIRALLLLALAAAVPQGAGASESAAGRKDPARAITSQLICPCSCGEILSGCTCETGRAMQGYVDRELKAGKSKDQIEAALVTQYGEVILGAPKPEGFNLLVWVLPFVATAIGFSIATMFLLRWARRRPALAQGDAAPGTPGSTAGRSGSPSTAEQDLEALRARAEAELERFRE